MKWTLGLFLLAAAGCGYRQDTKMVACPETGCPQSMAKASPQGLRYRSEPVRPSPAEEGLQAPPVAPLPDTAPPPPEPPPATP